MPRCCSSLWRYSESAQNKKEADTVISVSFFFSYRCVLFSSLYDNSQLRPCRVSSVKHAVPSCYLSSLRSLSSSSCTLFSSSVSPAEGRVCPSMSAIRDFSSFSCHQLAKMLRLTVARKANKQKTKNLHVFVCVGEPYLSLERALIHFQVVSLRTLLHQLGTQLVHLGRRMKKINVQAG